MSANNQTGESRKELDMNKKQEQTIDRHCPDCGDYIMPLDWCGCTDPTDANYKGYSCPECGNTRMKCECKELVIDTITPLYYDLAPSNCSTFGK